MAGSEADVDIGTALENQTGLLHLTTRTIPRLSIDALGRVGINNSAPTRTLDVNGSIRLRAGLPVKGSILTSEDGSGNATWESPVAFLARGVETTNSANVIPSVTDKVVLFNSETYDLGSDFNLSNGTFTAPITGIYHFDAALLWNNPGANTGYVAVSLLNQNNSVIATSRVAAVNSTDVTTLISTTIRLTTGSTVRVAAYQAVQGGVNETLETDSRVAWFNGYLVKRSD